MQSNLRFLALALTLSVSAAFSQIGEVMGEWKNVNPNTAGLTRVQITEGGTDVSIHAWGKCHPDDCDWGTVPGHLYGKSVTDSLVPAAHAISAISRTSFSETVIIVHLTSPGQLQVETMTRFIDGSGRTSYTHIDTFARVLLLNR